MRDSAGWESVSPAARADAARFSKAVYLSVCTRQVRVLPPVSPRRRRRGHGRPAGGAHAPSSSPRAPARESPGGWRHGLLADVCPGFPVRTAARRLQTSPRTGFVDRPVWPLSMLAPPLGGFTGACRAAHLLRRQGLCLTGAPREDGHLPPHREALCTSRVECRGALPRWAAGGSAAPPRQHA